MTHPGFRLTILFGAALALVSQPAAGAGLVLNGSFESNGGVGELAGGITSLSSWSVGPTTDAAPFPFAFIVNSSADTTGFPSIFSPPSIKIWGPGTGVANGFTGSNDGGYFLGVDGAYATAPVSQVISGLTVGNSYTLSFEWAGSQFTDTTGATSQSWGVTFGSDTVSTPTANVASQGFSGWTNYSHTFVAGSASQTLSFLASGTPAGLPPFLLLDGVSLTEEVTGGEAPEPGTVVLMLSSLAGALFLGRRAILKQAKN